MDDYAGPGPYDPSQYPYDSRWHDGRFRKGKRIDRRLAGETMPQAVKRMRAQGMMWSYISSALGSGNNPVPVASLIRMSRKGDA